MPTFLAFVRMRERGDPKLSNQRDRIMDFLVKIFKAVANQHRINLLHLLKGGEKEISELSKKLKLPYKTVARNLKILERTNLVISRRWHGSVYYCLRNEDHLEYNRTLYDLIEKRHTNPAK